MPQRIWAFNQLGLLGEHLSDLSDGGTNEGIFDTALLGEGSHGVIEEGTFARGENLHIAKQSIPEGHTSSEFVRTTEPMARVPHGLDQMGHRLGPESGIFLQSGADHLQTRGSCRFVGWQRADFSNTTRE